MNKKIDKKNTILNVLKEHNTPLISKEISQILTASGIDLSERTIRFHLSELDSQGLTEKHGKKGRTITPQGLSKLHASQISQRCGYLSSKIDQMIYRMNFDLPMRSGTLVVNTSIVEPHQFASCLDKICQVFEKNFGMGKLTTLLGPGEKIGEVEIPQDKIGFCTVCSITINGVLLKHGVPMTSRFGGLLEITAGKPTRFTEMIHYDGTSIDPLEVFIRSGMTNYHGAIKNGTGLIGASFREIPAEGRQRFINIGQRLEQIGLGAIMTVGLPGQPLLEIPVSHGRVGAILVGGLNPIAILAERGEQRIFSRALSGLIEYDRLFSYTELPEQIQKFL